MTKFKSWIGMLNFKHKEPWMLDEQHWDHLKTLYANGVSDYFVTNFLSVFGRDGFISYAKYDMARQRYLFGAVRPSTTSTQPDGVTDMQYITIERTNGYLKIADFTFSRQMLSEIKRRTNSIARRWCPSTKNWYFSFDHLDTLKSVLTQYGVRYIITGSTDESTIVEKNILVEFINQDDIKYNDTPEFSYSLGATVNTNWYERHRYYPGFLKQRELFSISFDAVYNYLEKEWKAGLSKKKQSVITSNNYFDILGIEQTSFESDPSVAKRSFLALAKVHHPDVGGNHSDFLRVKNAYDILSDPLKAKRYMVSLKLIEKNKSVTQRVMGNTSSFRMGRFNTCGMMKVKGFLWLGVFVIIEIISWDEAIDPRTGKKMVSEFNQGTGTYSVKYY